MSLLVNRIPIITEYLESVTISETDDLIFTKEDGSTLPAVPLPRCTAKERLLLLDVQLEAPLVGKLRRRRAAVER